MAEMRMVRDAFESGFVSCAGTEFNDRHELQDGSCEKANAWDAMNRVAGRTQRTKLLIAVIVCFFLWGIGERLGPASAVEALKKRAYVNFTLQPCNPATLQPCNPATESIR